MTGAVIDRNARVASLPQHVNCASELNFVFVRVNLERDFSPFSVCTTAPAERLVRQLRAHA